MATNPEILAINQIDRSLGALKDEKSRERVLNFVASKYTTTPETTTEG